MALLKDFDQFKSAYINDRKEFFQLRPEERQRRKEEYLKALEVSTTLYVGNISFFTTETQVHDVFSRCGMVKQIIMGLDRIHKTPCGFCFVEFEKRAEAEDAVKYLNQTRLDDRVIRIDWDKGNVLAENRQYGRGLSGGQVRDEYRDELDRGRGGMGKRRARDLGLELSDWTKGLVQYEREDVNPERLRIRPERWARRDGGAGITRAQGPSKQVDEEAPSPKRGRFGP
eukprot:GGOE01036424.1.p1 GENE.GGOE01036424.1~~GGOE01036424.1.p1  ORF type:complete len:228 (+),score=27.03 GGOE01036424.1:77-760(+)